MALVRVADNADRLDAHLSEPLRISAET